MRLAPVALTLVASAAWGQTVTVDTTIRFQSIDGFGVLAGGNNEPTQTWWQQLYFSDLKASMMRIDITPSFKAPYANLSYCSPWFGQPAPLNLNTANGNQGPDGTRTRRYTSPSDYSAVFPSDGGGCSAPIAVMGPDIDQNVAAFDFTQKAVAGQIAQLGKAQASALGDFKLYASVFSPAPWLKVSSGNNYAGGAWPLPTAGVAWPFIWGGNFSGGKLDESGVPLAVFDDSALDGGTGPTSALTQFARGLAAFLRGFQNAYGVQLYAISIQNELNFEEFYNSATYPLTSQYITALVAARAELDKYPDLRGIRIIGPEDLAGEDGYAMWQYGASGPAETDKNLHYLRDIGANPDAGAALAGFAIHSYAANGATSAGVDAQSWLWWANGWTTAPSAGIPPNIAGFLSFQKPSWMTETSGESADWLASSAGDGGFPDQGAFSIAMKLHQALVAGQESAWLYLALTDGNPSTGSNTTALTDSSQQADAGKYVAAKHFFRFIRPGARRVSATASGAPNLLASAYVLDAASALTVVLVNEGASPTSVSVSMPAALGLTSMASYTSSNASLWSVASVPVAQGAASLSLPGYGVVTLYGAGAAADAGTPQPDGGSTSPPDGGAASPDGGSPQSGAHGGCGCAVGDASAWVVLAALAFASRRRAGARTYSSGIGPHQPGR